MFYPPPSENTPTYSNKKPKCYNCIFASPAFKIAGKTHHQCCHPKHQKGFETGELSPWDTLQEFYNTCTDHKPKIAPVTN